jgi:OOP family OmpA-OmpF porin
MSEKLVGFAVAVTLSLSAFSASAEGMYRDAWYAVPGVAHMDTGNDLDADNDTGAFIAIGKELGQSWDFQVRLGYNKANEDTKVSGASGDYKSTQLGLDALYMFNRDSFRPFLLAGFGATRNDVDYKYLTTIANGKRTSFMASLGLGMQYFFSDSFGVQADLRRQFSRSKITTAGVSSSNSTRNNLLSLGGIFRFGAPAPVVAAVAPEPAPIPVVEPAPIPVVEPAPIPVVEPVPVCIKKLDTVTIDATKLFRFDKYVLKAEGKAALDQTAAQLNANPAITNVLVTGHTDRLGSYAYNQKLADRRAAQVAQYLATKGVNSDVITSTGRGEAVPVVACEGVKDRKALIKCLQPNRRVTVEAVATEEVCK